MKHLLRRFLFGVVLATAPQWASAQVKVEFPLQDGDIWVMAGDSITAQHLHSDYFEAFCFARYPNLKFSFRNSGVGGHTIPTTLARFDYDIAGWKPTVVSVELGMNDFSRTPTEQFVANMGTMVGRIRAIKARPVIFAASPINNGDTLAKLTRNSRLHEYALALKEFSAKESIPYADQFHALVDIWGNNKPREALAGSLPTLRLLAGDDSLAGVEHLRAFLAAQEKLPIKPAVSLQGDEVHLGPPGQLMMAAALLKELGADGFVSSVTVDGKGKVTDAKGCTVDGIKAEGEKIEFDRLDERLPFPIADKARAVLPLYPTILDLSQYTLKVTGLKDGNHALKINGIAIATLTAKELEAGVNLTSFGASPQAQDVNPIVAQGRAILAAVSTKEIVVSEWRALSKKAHAAGAAPELEEQLAALTKKVEEANEKIREAAKPRKMHFELSPAK
jgi:lysophospholipase L1-like esterase